VEFNIADIFESVADAVPERLALVAGDTRLTYRQLDERITRVAHGLTASGVQPGEHVGILAYNCAEWVETFFACFKIGAVPINVNYRYVEDELRYLFDNADLTALVLQQQFAPRVAAIRDDVPKLQTFLVVDDGSAASLDGLPGALDFATVVDAAPATRDFPPRSGDALYILYTGGTTGMPKGVMWRNEDVIFVLGGGFDPVTNRRREGAHEYSEQAAASSGGLVMFPLPPLMHGAGQWGLVNALFSANTVVLNTMPSFDAAQALRTAEREKVNVISITGDAMGRPLADALAAPGADYDLSSLISVTSTAAVFSPSVKDLFVQHLPNVILGEAIGSTETGTNGLAVKGAPAAGRGGPNVVPSPGTEVLDDNGVPVARGEVGWLARGGNVPLGYYKDPEKSARTFPVYNGVRYSIPGDYARVEDDGTITLLGRGSVCINTGGEKVYPEEVEGVVKSHPDVFDAIVVGVPDDRFGQRVAVVASPRPGRSLDLASIDAHCRGFIAGYKVPRELHVVTEVQRQPSGKPDYPWAQEYALKARAGS
jgi:acyl-CoA synthetase (AMP-forming)/AMP-acid ligase II